MHRSIIEAAVERIPWRQNKTNPMHKIILYMLGSVHIVVSRVEADQWGIFAELRLALIGIFGTGEQNVYWYSWENVL